jgi:hypothetical protein
MSAQVRLDAVIVAAVDFRPSPDISFRSSVTGRLVRVVMDVAVRTASRPAGATCRPLSFCLDKALNSAPHSPEDSQRDRK